MNLFSTMLILFGVTLASCQALQAPRFDYPELMAPAKSQGLSHEQHFEHYNAESNHHLKLVYNVTFLSSVFHVEDLDGASLVSCHENRVELSLEESAKFELQPGHIITSNSGLFCKNRQLPLMHMISGISWIGGKKRQVTLRASPVPLAALLESGTIEFSTNRIHWSHIKPGIRQRRPSNEDTSKWLSHDKKRFIGEIFNFFAGAVQVLVDGLEVVFQAVNFAVNVTNALVTLAADGSFTLPAEYVTFFDSMWNYDGNSGAVSQIVLDDASSPATSKALCRNCFFALDSGILFKLSVSQDTNFGWGVNEFALLLRGDARTRFDIHLDAGGDVMGSYIVWEDQLLAKQIKFTIGPVPVIIDITFDVALGFRGTFQAVHPWHGEIGGFACVELGYEFNVLSGAIEPVDRLVFEYDSELDKVASVDFSAALQVFTKGVARLSLYGMGGVYARITPYIELAITVGQDADCSANSEMYLGLNAGLQVAVGAFVQFINENIKIYEREWEPSPVYSGKTELLGICIGGGDKRQSSSITNVGMSVGRVWSGRSQGQHCTEDRTIRKHGCLINRTETVEYFAQDFTLQLIGRDQDQGDLFFLMESITLFDGGATNRIVPNYGYDRLRHTPLTDSDGDGVPDIDDGCSLTPPNSKVYNNRSNTRCEYDEMSHNIRLNEHNQVIKRLDEDPANIGCVNSTHHAIVDSITFNIPQIPDSLDRDRDEVYDSWELREYPAPNGQGGYLCSFDLDVVDLPSCVFSTDSGGVEEALELPCIQRTKSGSLFTGCRYPRPSLMPSQVKCWMVSLYRAKQLGDGEYSFTFEDGGNILGGEFVRRCSDLNDRISIEPFAGFQGRFVNDELTLTHVQMPGSIRKNDNLCPSIELFSVAKANATGTSLSKAGKKRQGGVIQLEQSFNTNGQCKYADVQPNTPENGLPDISLVEGAHNRKLIKGDPNNAPRPTPSPLPPGVTAAPSPPTPVLVGDLPGASDDAKPLTSAGLVVQHVSFKNWVFYFCFFMLLG